MNKILICASRMSHILHFHLPYIEYFYSKGVGVDIAAQGASPIPWAEHCYDIPFVKNPLSPQNLKTVSRLKKLMKTNHYDMVCSNSTLSGAAARMALRRLPHNERPRCVHISHGYMFDSSGSLRSRVYRTVEKLLAPDTDSLVVMNREDLQLAEKYRLGKSIVFVNGMGLCPERFPSISSQERSAFRKQLGADEETAVLLCIGEFSARKNHSMLIRAFDRLGSLRNHTLLVFAGTGDEAENCKDLTRRLELTPYVRFLGQVEDINTLCRSADVLLSAAGMEGLPFNVMEALFCGLPVVASDIKGHRDLIVNGQNGLLFDASADNGIQQLTDRLVSLLSDIKLYSHLKQNAVLDEKYLIHSVKPSLLQVFDTHYLSTEIKTTEVTDP